LSLLPTPGFPSAEFLKAKAAVISVHDGYAVVPRLDLAVVLALSLICPARDGDTRASLSRLLVASLVQAALAPDTDSVSVVIVVIMLVSISVCVIVRVTRDVSRRVLVTTASAVRVDVETTADVTTTDV